jgi:hypothetical protein
MMMEITMATIGRFMKNLDIEDLRCSYDWPEEDFFSETSLAPSVFGAS